MVVFVEWTLIYDDFYSGSLDLGRTLNEITSTRFTFDISFSKEKLQKPMVTQLQVIV